MALPQLTIYARNSNGIAKAWSSRLTPRNCITDLPANLGPGWGLKTIQDNSRQFKTSLEISVDISRHLKTTNQKAKSLAHSLFKRTQDTSHSSWQSQEDTFDRKRARVLRLAGRGGMQKECPRSAWINLLCWTVESLQWGCWTLTRLLLESNPLTPTALAELISDLSRIRVWIPTSSKLDMRSWWHIHKDTHRITWIARSPREPGLRTKELEN